MGELRAIGCRGDRETAAKGGWRGDVIEGYGASLQASGVVRDGRGVRESERVERCEEILEGIAESGG